MADKSSHVLEKNERPDVGYKMLKLKDGTCVLATLKIPPASNVMKTSYRVSYRGQPAAEKSEGHALYRTNAVFVTSIESIDGIKSRKLHLHAVSRKNNGITYTVGRVVEVPNTKYDMADGPGIHFFKDAKFAKMWSMLLR